MPLAKDLIGIGVPPVMAQGIGGQGATGLVAAGSTQGTALALVASNNVIATAALSTGVILPAVQAGEEVWVYNAGANTVNVYPPLGAAINSGATNAAFTLATTVSGQFKFVSNTVIIANRSA
jgi:hypothetical protein